MKKITIAMLIITLGISFLQINSDIGISENEEGRIIYVDDDGDTNYTSIKEAINNASDGDTIYVYNGIYDEYFCINKSISLIGESKENTRIRYLPSLSISKSLILILADNVTISNFTIKNNVVPIIDPNDSSPPTWIYDYGIGIEVLSNNNIISGNIIQNNAGYGILLNHSQNTKILKNNLTKHTQACIYFKSSSNNLITNNTIINNERGIIFHINSTNNILYHNNFVNNTYYNAYCESNNSFYNTNLQQGNYWDDYNGTDKNNDAIGDTPYSVSGGYIQDPYPLMNLFLGRLTLKEYYVEIDALFNMLIIGVVIAIIVSIPIAYVWYRKIRP
jgi:parallel beta-helix repeat protein